MATIAEKMAVSLEELRKLQEQHPCVVLQGTKEIGRTHLTRLLDNGWLQEVMKGYCVLAFYSEICGCKMGRAVVSDR